MSINTLRDFVMFIVEDNMADIAFFKEALGDASIPAAVHVAGDGDEAMRFLRRQPPFADAPRPDVMVLDLNLPVRNGREVLVEMASDPLLNRIPVAVFTTSSLDGNIIELYPEGRCKYFVKTGDFFELVGIVKRIIEFSISVLRG